MSFLQIVTVNIILQILTYGPYDYLLREAMKRKVNVQNLSKNFEKNTNAKEVKAEKVSDVKKNKKLKTENSEAEKSKLNEEEKEDDDFQNSYMLTMSQSICNLDKTEDSECVFEPFTQVSRVDDVFFYNSLPNYCSRWRI